MWINRIVFLWFGIFTYVSLFRLPIPRTSVLRLCNTPVLKNGQVRLRQRGKLIRYQCNPGFILYGERYSACLNGQWENPVPYCIKSGCPLPKPPSNSYLALQNNDASVMLFCKPGYELAGSTMMLCNGQNWDRNIGTCREVQIGPAVLCDFESSNLCGWINYLADNVEWLRRDSIMMQSRMKLGPIHDHTYQDSYQGHYMNFESYGQQIDAAHLMSPVYPANFSENACFRFYYYMYGSMAGRLRVYMKPQSVPLPFVLMNAKYQLFDEQGSHKNHWHEAFTEVEPISEDFQIVIEATSGSLRHCNIAIDDVALLTDGECLTESLQTILPTTEEPGGVFETQSCVNRCQEMPGVYETTEEIITNGTGRGGVLVHCQCYDGCEETKSCCYDYRDVCAFATDIPELLTTVPEINISILSTTEIIVPTTLMINPTTMETTSTTVKTTTTTLKPTTTSTFKPTNTSTKKPSPTTTKITTTTPITTKTTTISTTPNIRKKPTTISTSTVKVTTTTIRKNSTISPTKLTTKPTTSKTKITTFNSKTLASTVTTSKAVMTKAVTKPASKAVSFMSTSSITTATVRLSPSTSLPTEKYWKSTEERADDNAISSINLVLYISIIGIIIGFLLTLIFVYKFRPNYISFVSKRRCKNANEEFNEIRYLIEDEQLDFTSQAAQS